jgi:glycosyltransferase involved in cell wall biosynthesis
MRVAIDSVIFQLQKGRPLGISRIWRELLPELMAISPDIEFAFYERAGAPFPFKIPDNRRNSLPPYTWGEEAVRHIHADLFISTYYTYAEGISNLLYVYDMIPEQLGWAGLEWDAKRKVLEHADKIVAMSETTLDSLRRHPGMAAKIVGVVSGGVNLNAFHPAPLEEMQQFRQATDLRGGFILLVGRRGHYKNGNTIFPALANLPFPPAILLAGGEAEIPPKPETIDVVYAESLDDDELRAAYSAAMCLYYPSSLEGFGLPVLEAMACGCPVIVGPAVATRAFAVGLSLEDPEDPEHVRTLLKKSMDVEIRASLITQGLQRAQHYTWRAAAEQMRKAILS